MQNLFTRKTPLCIFKSSDVLASVTGVYLTACPCQTTTTVVWHSSFPHSSVLSARWLWCPFKDTTAETDLSQGSKIKASASFSQDELFMLTLWGHTDCISANSDCKQIGLFRQLTLCRVKTFLRKNTHQKKVAETNNSCLLQQSSCCLPAGSACSLGTATLPAIRPTSLLLYRTESSDSTILDGSSCFMLFHQSAAEETKWDTKSCTSRISKKKEPGRTCAIPVREVVRSLWALLPARRGQVKSWRQRGEICRLNDNKENTHLFLQSSAQTTATMKAVTTMNNTGTRTAVSATSDSKDTPVNTRWPRIKTAFLNFLTHLCWCGGAWWCFLCLACVWFGRGEAGVWSPRGVECDERGWSSWAPASLPKQKQKKPNLNLRASDAHTCLFICCIKQLRLYVRVCLPGIWQPSSSNLSAILWCHEVGFILT